eukprot:scaffold120487_cov20-Tisochrysis_lutea.AAC.4
MPKKFLSLFFHVPCTYLLAHVGAEDYAACAEARRAQAPCKPHPRGSHRQAQGEGVCVRVHASYSHHLEGSQVASYVLSGRQEDDVLSRSTVLRCLRLAPLQVADYMLGTNESLCVSGSLPHLGAWQ